MVHRSGTVDTRQMSLWDWSAPAPDRVVQVPKQDTVRRAKRDAGRTGYEAGASAELRVAQDYERRGFPLARRRWRGQGGEIDLIVRDGDGLIFVEVKKSRSFQRAAERLSRQQMNRIISAAEEFLGTQPRGSLTDVRFDLAMVDGYGQIRVIENAIGHC
ncbi:hypothetical protein CDO87_08490 [Sagittula sp. P11]|nr:hypothetical protein CDO87_08490 [Sagittula sp. P11]